MHLPSASPKKTVDIQKEFEKRNAKLIGRNIMLIAQQPGILV